MMTHLLLDSIDASRREALKLAQKVLIERELLQQTADIDCSLVQRVAESLEMATLYLILDRFEEDEEKTSLLRQAAADAFRLYRILPRKDNPLEEGIRLLKLGSLALLGDMGSDAARLLREIDWPQLPPNSADWHDRTWSAIIDVWLRLIWKKGWDDLDAVLEKIAQLRNTQNEFEKQYFEGKEPSSAKVAALELIGLYHLAKAAEIMAYFITDGVIDGNYQIHQLLDTHFNQVFAVCKTTQLPKLETLTRLLSASAAQIIETQSGKT